MKMHKKLFGLLATAVVGLTLTSCGGGGGGGGSSDDDTPPAEQTPTYEGTVYSPASLSGKKLNYMQLQTKGGATLVHFSFMSGMVYITEQFHQGGILKQCESERPYTYVRDPQNPNKATLEITFDFCNSTTEDKNNDGVYKEEDGEFKNTETVSVVFGMEFTKPDGATTSISYNGETQYGIDIIFN